MLCLEIHFFLIASLMHCRSELRLSPNVGEAAEAELASCRGLVMSVERRRSSFHFDFVSVFGLDHRSTCLNHPHRSVRPLDGT